ncbi:MAG TPA: mechanosensitive ion channel family protein [Vicinamibacterales bacterium]|nr:mechanosensitive ion channel family protein [Vicinamibacterales bacterium]
MILGAAALAATLGVMTITINRHVRRKLRLSLVLIAVYLGLTLFLALRPDLARATESQLHDLDNLALAAALINALVIALINPLRIDRIPDRFPTILQDAIVIGLVLLTASFLSANLVPASAVSAVVLGFALQDTLGNAFAGLAIQSEKPFHVGHWIRVGDFEGRVSEVTWRATKLRTKAGNFVVVPNNIVAKEAIINYSAPVMPSRLDVEVGGTYLVPPNQAKAAVMDAMRSCAIVLSTPEPEVHIKAFEGSAIAYLARFYIADYEQEERAVDEVRTAIYYAMQRHGVEIPWPVQVEYSREWHEPDPEERVQEQERLLAGVDLFAALSPELRREIAAATSIALYASGERIVRQGDPGESMFVICSGTVSVVLEPANHEVAQIHDGGYFGEMSLLTGDPRSATVVARGDVRLVEVSAGLFRRLGAEHPEAIERIGVAAVTRRAELDRARTAAAGAVAIETSTLLTRMKRFLRLT